ncbi:hypothetical protein CEW92_08480 [Bacillaceae bacterium SAS-127]|nr:hypothetical protein CEW92_08480 [Bacillaceae bacterium SAS-127]
METKDKNATFSTRISEKIWGHRFKDGQRGPEYTLEFLNIMAGTQYKLGAYYYDRKKMTEFRSFVFEGEKEGKRAKDGSSDYVHFEQEKKENLIKELGIDEQELGDLQEFFQHLSIDLPKKGGKDDRSWYAKMLFPLNETLLFFEVRKNKDSNSLPFERNFFGRGGELYYLMLTYGTKNRPELKKSIEEKLNELLTNNQNIQTIIRRICTELEESCVVNYEQPKYPSTLIKDESLEYHFKEYEKKEYPLLPCDDLPLYDEMADELNALLSLRIDVYEMFSLLTSLICFQLYRYMIHQAEQISGENVQFVIDCLDGQEPNIKRLAHHAFKDHERIIRESFDSFTDKHLEKIIPEQDAHEMLIRWRDDAKSSTDKNKYKLFLHDIGYHQAKSRTKNELIHAIEVSDDDQALKLLRRKIKEISRNELNKSQFPIVRTLGRDGGFLLYGTGVQGRYVMSDTFLTSLVYSVLVARSEMDFHQFMDELYKKYNIIIGPNEARISGLHESEGINLRIYANNENRLRMKLKKNGLLHEYSDATALIYNPYRETGGY